MEAWEIVTYGNGEFLRTVFNGIVMIMGDDTYAILVKILMLVGFLWVLTGAAFNMKLMSAPTWLISAIMVMYLLLIPRVNVIIIDRINPATGNSVVANVPIGIGLTASFMSQLGDWLTTGYETVFSMPDDLNYSENGMLFGQRLVEASTRLKLMDSRVEGNFQEFFNTCVLYDVGLGLYNWNALMDANNLWEFLQGHTSEVRRYHHRAADGSGDLLVCREAAQGVLNADLEAAIEASQRRFGVQLLGKKILASLGYESSQPINNVVATQALNQVSTMTVSAYNYLGNLSADAAALMRQNIMINAMRDAAQGAAIANDSAAAAISYAVARAEAERRATWKTMGVMALRTLPLLRNVFEALIYAVFPIFLLMALVAPKQAITSYVQSLVWIQLWAPLYAILHGAVSVYASYEASNALFGGTNNGLTMNTNGELREAMTDMGHVAGYASIFIPMIAYMLVSKGGMMMASMAGGVMQGIQGIAARAADEATTGNIKLGENSQDNINWFKQDTSVMNNSGYGTTTDASGLQERVTSSGIQTMNAPINAAVDKQLSSSLTSAANRSQELARQSGETYTSSLAQSVDNLSSFHTALNQGTINSQGWDDTDRSQFDNAWGKMQEAGRNFEQAHGLEAGTGVKAVALAQANIGWNAEGVSSFFGGLSATLKAEGHSSVDAKELFKSAQAFAQKENVSESFQVATTFGEKLGTEYRDDVTKGMGTDLAASLRDTQTHQQSWQDNEKNAQTYQAAIDQVERNGGSVGMDFTGMAQQHLREAFGQHEYQRLMSGINSGTISPEDRNRVQAELGQFASQNLSSFVQQYGQDDLNQRFNAGEKPTWDKDNFVPGTADQLRQNHVAQAENLRETAHGQGVLTEQEVNQTSDMTKRWAQDNLNNHAGVVAERGGDVRDQAGENAERIDQEANKHPGLAAGQRVVENLTGGGFGKPSERQMQELEEYGRQQQAKQDKDNQ